ncbi:MATE family efflux transporter [Butyrivibrio sp. AE3004]|uniref:MATE family efflux transporter n=1 Tax=Butyrivibrio sp. AE3004 TaxID=1506994 RepID=UPI0004949083|nr:MATE family efflux transporter [Butyrivibrio sp. AE3004]
MSLGLLIEPKEKLPEDRQLFSNTMLKAMIIPLVIEQLLQMIVGLADTMMVSYAGEAVVAGVGLDTMIYTVFIYLFTAVASGGAVVVSQYIGSRERKNANLSASQIYTISFIVSVVSMVLMLLSGNALLAGMYPDTEPLTMDACKTYMWIASISFPANALYNAGCAIYRSMGKTKTTMKVTLVSNIINVIGNSIGIFILHAGAAGVAWPTTISWYVAAIIMTILCFRKEHVVNIELKDILRLDFLMDKRILGVAIPNSIENTLFQAAKVALGMLVATFGTSQIAANTTGQTFWSLAACMNVSMGTVFITVIGQCVGADDSVAARWYMIKLTKLSLFLAMIWNVAVMILTPLLLPFYSLGDDTKLLILIIVAIHNAFAAVIQPFSGPLSSGLRAAGDVSFTMWTSIFSTVVCRTILSFLLAKWLGMGVVGIALAMGLDWCIKSALDIWRFFSGKWMNRKVI